MNIQIAVYYPPKKITSSVGNMRDEDLLCKISQKSSEQAEVLKKI